MRVCIVSPVNKSVQLPKRNDKCICGSGRKAKRCCLLAYEKKRAEGIAEAQKRLDTTGSVDIKTVAKGRSSK